MKKQEQDSIVYRMEVLEDLVIKQQQALDMSNQLIDMKTRLLELCEEETAIYRRENATLKVMCVAAFITVISICGALLFYK